MVAAAMPALAPVTAFATFTAMVPARTPDLFELRFSRSLRRSLFRRSLNGSRLLAWRLLTWRLLA